MTGRPLKAARVDSSRLSWIYTPKKKTSGMRRKLVTIRGWWWKHGNSCRNPKNPLNLHFVRIASLSGVCIDPRYRSFYISCRVQGCVRAVHFSVRVFFSISQKKQLGGFIHIFFQNALKNDKIAWRPPQQIVCHPLSRTSVQTHHKKNIWNGLTIVFLWWGYIV